MKNSQNYILKSKKSFEIPFTLIFGIIAGVVILLLAIYGTARLINNSQQVQYSESAKTLLNILNPVVNDIESTFVQKPISFRKETRIYLNCMQKSEKSPVFGKETLAFSEKSAFLKKWPNPGINVSRYNKYIFADRIEEGKKLFIFSKPFYSGFRVDDLVVLSMKNFCFVNAPGFLADEVENRGYYNINSTINIDKCPSNSLRVCFERTGEKCDISVYGLCTSNCDDEMGKYSYGYVQKNAKTVYYAENLLFAAIFSSPEIYECNLGRLGKKISELSKVYSDEVDMLSLKGCNTLIGSGLSEMISLGENLTSKNILSLYQASKNMNRHNCENVQCKIYESADC
jgi:hypothetical protein